MKIVLEYNIEDFANMALEDAEKMEPFIDQELVAHEIRGSRGEFKGLKISIKEEAE